jgi:hypothetical protein
VASKQDNRAYGLIDLYVLVYEQKFKKKPVVNKYRDRWGFTAMIEDLGYERSVEVIKYYFNTTRANYTLVWLFNNYDKLNQSLTERDADRAHRAKVRAQTAARMEETP